MVTLSVELVVATMVRTVEGTSESETTMLEPTLTVVEPVETATPGVTGGVDSTGVGTLPLEGTTATGVELISPVVLHVVVDVTGISTVVEPT